jgi:hypothetical protein
LLEEEVVLGGTSDLEFSFARATLVHPSHLILDDLLSNPEHYPNLLELAGLTAHVAA